MTRGFWEKLKEPIFVLAPMANVTDFVFRELIAEMNRLASTRGENKAIDESTRGGPDIFFTEFVSVDGLCSPGKDKLLVDLKFSENQRPIVAQIFGSKPENFTKVAKLLVELGFDGIDINMGCPDRAVEKQGAGAALIKNPKLAQEIIMATHEGDSRMPISVKTRLGYNKITIDEWLPQLVECDLAALTIHLRTRKEMSLVPAHWELMPQIIELVKKGCHCTRKPFLRKQESYQDPASSVGWVEPCNHPLILGNGDVMTIQDAQEKIKESGCDGVMLGRGIFGNPWLFQATKGTPLSTGVPFEEKLSVMIKHTQMFEKEYVKISAKGSTTFGGKSFDVMKKHYKAYVNNFEGAKELRMKLMETKTAEQVLQIVLEHFPKVENYLSS